MLQNISISNKYCSFKITVHQSVLKKVHINIKGIIWCFLMISFSFRVQFICLYFWSNFFLSLYFWSNKCSLVEHNRPYWPLINNSWKIQQHTTTTGPFYLVPGWNAASSWQTSVKWGIADIRSNTGSIREKVFRRTSYTWVSTARTALQPKITLKDIDKLKINLICQTVMV